MNNHNFGEVFEREAPRSTRPSRSSTRVRQSYNENLIAPSIGERDDGDANASTFPCTAFMQDAWIMDDFLYLVDRVGLTSYMLDESNQYAMLTKIFVESFTFHNAQYHPTVAFKIYNSPVTMTLENFCGIIGVSAEGIKKKITDQPADLLALYREVMNDDTRIAQRGKIRNIQFPAIRYFAYYLATSILGRENTGNIYHYHLAFLAAALNGSTRYSLGALVARRLAGRGPIYGGIIAARIVAAYGYEIDPNDVLLAPQRLDLAAMKAHHFVTSNSSAGNLVYRMLFTNGDERKISLPQPTLFDVRSGPWSCSSEEMDEKLRLLEFHRQNTEEDAADYNSFVQQPGASSSTYQGDGASSSYYGGDTSPWPAWN